MRASFRFQIFLTLLLIPLLIIAAFIYEQQNSRFRIRQYIGIWEDDIAEGLLVKQDSGLLEKIRSQLVLVVPAVRQTEVIVPGVPSVNVTTESSWTTSSLGVPLSLNLNPVGEVLVRLSNQSLLMSSLVSPIFGLGLVLIMGLSLLFARREFRLEIARAQLGQRLKLEKEFADMALQVAHDIRGPLTALTTIAGKAGAVDAQILPLLESASQRIQGIAEELLEKSRPRKSGHIQLSEDLSPKLKHKTFDHEEPQESVGQLLEKTDSLVSEFRLRFPRIEWLVKSHWTAGSEHVSLPLKKIQRMLSNILQNAADAIEGTGGKVQIEIFVKAGKLHLRIQDSGKGISEDVLLKLLKEGGSYGKSAGHGLGLKDVRDNLQQVGGRFDLQSRVGVGTIVLIEIPVNLP